MPANSPFHADGLGKTAANHAPLTPLSLLARTAEVYPHHLAVVYGARRYTWAQTAERCRRLASALAAAGVGCGDTVAVMGANTPETIEAHFGVPMAGAVLNTLNTRLDAPTLAFMLRHAEAKVLIADTEFSATVRDTLALLDRPPLVIDIDDRQGPRGARMGAVDYEGFIALDDPNFTGGQPLDEWQAIALNYTSGTTGNPKGVVYHHRGAYLAALSNMIDWGMPRHSVMLWTLPLFHCNGWCFPWTMAANAGTNICLRRVDPERILSLIREHCVTHYCGAPVVHAMLANAPDAWKSGIGHPVEALIGGAPPPVPVIAAMERMGFSITQIYGLTEVYGPAAVCAPQPDWKDLDTATLASRKGRQGVRYTAQENMAVLDPSTMAPVPPDGVTIGEVMFRGNMTMMGYLKNPEATAEAFAGGWFHSGDLAVVQPDGYVQIKDRSKDVIISGGENINSVEVEEALYHHPAVLAAAVVARPDAKWGESPCAFVELRPETSATEAELIAHCRARLAHFKAPKTVIIGELPKTSTGKIQKFALREAAKQSGTHVEGSNR
ncbi:acyl-CoA synthetase [Azospirillum palustre]|uniref:3-methylmercaptopropionyl-CoA ligase n=1 Tax=Azospirillum palustre TaxID=2044885 RepID=A0A2B8BME3_9PROT|nr:acyl-CoA synthetase [Azospirillum palustre]PGH58713.1 acyl-CoA synthetase [Azospirillum palustre]